MSISIEVLWIVAALVTWGVLAAYQITVFTRTRFLLAVLYKSGNRQEQWFTEFDVHGGEWSWKSYHGNERPLVMGVSEIEATWVIDQRTNLFHLIYVNAKYVMKALAP